MEALSSTATERERPVRVLIVDDQLSIRTFVARVLGDAGYAVDAASDGAEALRIVETEGRFDLFVLDFELPVMRGDELASQLRQRQADAKVLFFTGYVDRLYKERPVLGPDEAILEKPVAGAGLREAVSRLLLEHTRAPGLPQDSGGPRTS
jgi:CheY-like chemotaxis protein